MYNFFQSMLNDESDLVNIEGQKLFGSYNSLNKKDCVVVYIDCELYVSCSQLAWAGCHFLSHSMGFLVSY